jgi:hypothetical protein
VLISRQFIIVSFFCFFVLGAHAQDDIFFNGYIIKDGKYIYGQIKTTSTPKENCLFKIRNEDTPVSYTLAEIEGYGIIDGFRFERKVLREEGNDKVVFLKALTEGAIVLYKHEQTMFLEKDGKFQEIVPDAQRLNFFKNVLEDLVSNCPKLVGRTKSLKFDFQALQTFVEQYNEWYRTGTIKRKKEHGANKFIEIFAGYNRADFSFSNEDYALKNQNFIDRTLLQGGANFSIQPRALKYIAFVTGLWYNDQRFFLDITNQGRNEGLIVRASYKEIKLPLMVQIQNFNQSAAQLYLKGGVTLPINLNNSLNITQIIVDGNGSYQERFAYSKAINEPIQLLVMSGVEVRIKSNISFFSELYYGSGKKKLDVPAVFRNKLLANFVDVGVNIGLKLK